MVKAICLNAAVTYTGNKGSFSTHGKNVIPDLDMSSAERLCYRPVIDMKPVQIL